MTAAKFINFLLPKLSENTCHLSVVLVCYTWNPQDERRGNEWLTANTSITTWEIWLSKWKIIIWYYRNPKNTGQWQIGTTNSLHIQKEHYTPPRGSMSKSGTTTTRASPNATPKPWPGWKIDRMPNLLVQFWNADEYSNCILTVVNPVAMFGLPGPHRQLPGKQHSPSRCASDMARALLLASVRRC